MDSIGMRIAEPLTSRMFLRIWKFRIFEAGKTIETNQL